MAFATINYFSKSLQMASSFNVVFPDDASIKGPWSVFYLLHGLSDDHTIWMRRTSVERYLGGFPLMLVMPNGGRGWYTNAKEGLAYEDDLVRDIVGLVDRTFPVKADRSGRCIGGLSMGGYGAIKVGVKHHEMFASANSHSGALGFASGKAGAGSELKGEFARIFGESPAGGDDDIFALIEKTDHGRLPAMRIDCGKDDFLIEQNRALHKRLDEMKIPHQYDEFPGNHTWAYWDEHVQQAIKFHARELGLDKP